MTLRDGNLLGLLNSELGDIGTVVPTAALETFAVAAKGVRTDGSRWYLGLAVVGRDCAMWRLGSISWRAQLLETRRPIGSARRRKWLLLRVLLPVLVLLRRKPEINPPTSSGSARIRAVGSCTNFSFVALSRSDRSLRSSSCSACPSCKMASACAAERGYLCCTLLSAALALSISVSSLDFPPSPQHGQQFLSFLNCTRTL